MEDNKRTNANAQYYNTQNAKSARHDSAHTPNNAFPKYINIYIYTVPTEPRTSFLFFYALLLLLLISSFILLCLLFRRLFVAHLCAPRLYDQKKKNKKNEHLWSDRNTNCTRFRLFRSSARSRLNQNSECRSFLVQTLRRVQLLSFSCWIRLRSRIGLFVCVHVCDSQDKFSLEIYATSEPWS